MIKKVFIYIEPLWLGKNGKVSIRSVLALSFSINFMINLSHAIYRWDSGRSLSDLAIILGVEAGLIAGLLALRTYQNTQFDNRIGDYNRYRSDQDIEFKGTSDNCGTE